MFPDGEPNRRCPRVATDRVTTFRGIYYTSVTPNVGAEGRADHSDKTIDGRWAWSSPSRLDMQPEDLGRWRFSRSHTSPGRDYLFHDVFAARPFLLPPAVTDRGFRGPRMPMEVFASQQRPR